MKAETLVGRIAECVDDLGLLLDQIYKFSQKERQNYFERIQSMKNRLLSLKSTVRESNTSLIEKQYKQLYLATNSLKNQIQHHNALALTSKETRVLGVSSKENREAWKCKDVKETVRNHQEALRLLADKDSEMRELKSLLLEKQEMIRLNYEELKKLRTENELLVQNEHVTKYQVTSLGLEIQRLNTLIRSYEEDIIQLRVREQEKDSTFAEAVQELEHLKGQLIQANKTIASLQQNAQTSFQKAQLSQENAANAQRNLKGLQQNYFLKQNDALKQIRAIAELELQLKLQKDLVSEEGQKIAHLRQDIEVLQNEVKKLDSEKAGLALELGRQKDIFMYEKGLLEKQAEKALIRENQLRRLLNEADKKYMTAINKLNAAEQFQNKLVECECQKEVLLQKILHFQNTFERLNRDLSSAQQRNKALLVKLEDESQNYRQTEVQIFRLREKIKIKDDQISQLGKTLDKYRAKIKECEKELDGKQKKEKAIETDLLSEKEKLVRLEEKDKARTKEISSLKVKLLRAKIETIHEIRSTISQ